MNKNTRAGFVRRIKQGIASVLATASLIIGINVATATPASAAEWKCPDWYHCALLLNKEETKKLANESFIPMNTASGPWSFLLQFVYEGHKPMIIQYANWDMCTKFMLSLAPWDSQGLDGYRC